MELENLLLIVEESSISVGVVALSVVLSFLLGLAISLVYKKTFRGVSYSQSFVTTLALLAPITTIVMLTIGSNLARAFGLVGALSIIRFRTVIKDTKDIMMVFLSLVIGLSVGTQNYHIAVVGALLILAFIIIMDRTNYGLFTDRSFLVSFYVEPESLEERDYTSIIQKYSVSYDLVNLTTINTDKKRIEITYKVEGLNSSNRSELITKLSNLKGVSDITLVSSKNYIEY